MKNLLEFIKMNRALGGVHHEYDVVIGPVADDNTIMDTRKWTRL